MTMALKMRVQILLVVARWLGVPIVVHQAYFVNGINSERSSSAV